MKKVPYLLMAVFIYMACQKAPVNKEQSINAEQGNEVMKRQCATQEVLEAQLAADPTLRQRLSSIEAFTNNVIKNKGISRIAADGVLEIPVVVNVIYNTATENISDAQIQSQIDVLNEDYNLRNADTIKIPSFFTTSKANVGIRFVLASVVRKANTKLSWFSDNSMKNSKTGGIAPTSPTTNLNIWIVNKLVNSSGQEILGYAQFPGGTSSTDGVVIGYKYFGRTGTVVAPFNKGRTATHEVGHWMNLKHIWGDAACGDDLVGDTPQHNAENFGCPSYPHYSTCAGAPVEMTMNYMDYVDDACMNMFSKGQKDRMLAIFASGGPRASFATTTTTTTTTTRK